MSTYKSRAAGVESERLYVALSKDADKALSRLEVQKCVFMIHDACFSPVSYIASGETILRSYMDST